MKIIMQRKLNFVAFCCNDRNFKFKSALTMQNDDAIAIIFNFLNLD